MRNDAPEPGIASSLQAALARARRRARDVDAVVVGLADQPLVGADAYRRVAAAYDDGARLAVATYGGVRGQSRSSSAARYWPEALALTGDEGARVLLRRHGATEVPCDGTGDPTDVDTPEDLAALEDTMEISRQLPSEHARSRTRGRCCSTSRASRRACPARSCRRSRATSTAAS